MAHHHKPDQPFRPKESLPHIPETPTQFMERHAGWKQLIDYCLRHLNKAGYTFLVGLLGVGGWHLNQTHAVTQDQLGLLWHQIHQDEQRLDELENNRFPKPSTPDPDQGSVGVDTLTNLATNISVTAEINH